MSMYDACEAGRATIAAIASGGPDAVQITTQDKQDLRPNRRVNSWVNVTPVSTERKDQSGSYDAMYSVMFSLWVTKEIRTGGASIVKTAADIWTACINALVSTWGEYARRTVTPGQIQDEWESGADGDIAYVIRATIPVEKQEEIT